MKSVTRTAPAKINLGLDVVGTRADGYHLLETVFQAVSIADTVTVSLVEQPGIALTCDHPAVPCTPKNIAWKAAQRFLEAAKITAGVQIHIAKRIPMEAGMGGGSTDGAAVLLALQELTQQALSEETLFSIAVSLGADVPFFLLGGTAYAAGIGEVLEPLPPFSAAHLVIAKGTAGVSTAAAYQEIDALEQPAHPPVQQLRQALEHGAGAAEIAPLCGNLFESAVHLDEVSEIRKSMLENGAYCSVMTGSGAAVFGLFPDADTAEQACAQLKKRAAFAEVCHTIQ
ncbi:4-(cytidine 5'-diphospho)-2-C-methyl-D-erythritol kinase [uncultured Ruminococcus sp.]|uniref:4-(cytidine 5'-diphospho)-2-C-methyl-D-erythritol kinase n=1 Tax=uncultured Ruminococcus sp. TaxID=165186 RepID=UPI0025ED4C15|nr:4-(cytidine 5'-diphospho)-2-C-methyl-D-erythritol kinase [uncultured Ruminococcus sp.]